jgi:hypothetical protein
MCAPLLARVRHVRPSGRAPLLLGRNLHWHVAFATNLFSPLLFSSCRMPRAAACAITCSITFTLAASFAHSSSVVFLTLHDITRIRTTTLHTSTSSLHTCVATCRVLRVEAETSARSSATANCELLVDDAQSSASVALICGLSASTALSPNSAHSVTFTLARKAIQKLRVNNAQNVTRDPNVAAASSGPALP